MQVVLFDLDQLIHRLKSYTPTGIDRVTIRYLHHFVSNPGRFRTFGVHAYARTCYLIDERLFTALYELLFSAWITVSVTPAEFKERSLALQQAFREFAPEDPHQEWPFDKKLRELRRRLPDDEFIYVNTAQNGFAQIPDLVFMRNLLKARIVTFVHDTIPIDFREYIERDDADRKAGIILNIGTHSDLIIVNSASTRNDLIRHLSAAGVPIPPIEVIFIGVEDKFLELAASASSAPTGHSDPYFVMVGTVEPRKNHLLLLNVWRQLASSGATDLPKLVIIGSRGWNNQNVFDMLDKCVPLMPHVIERSNLSDEEIISILKGALAILYPPFYEGWGMPLAEALTAGVPAVASDIPVFHECSQDKALFLDPLDGPGWKSAILELARPDNALLKQLKALAGEYRPNLWGKHFSQLDRVMARMEAQPERQVQPEPAPPVRHAPPSLVWRLRCKVAAALRLVQRAIHRIEQAVIS